jgi:rod shape-determining protein MreB
MHGTIPSEDDQRSILTAGDHIDKTLEKMLREKFPESTFNRNMIRQFKESFSHIGNGVPPVAVNIPIKGKPIAHDITGEMRKSCESILPPIVETMTDMIAKFDPEYQEKIRNNVWLAGCGSQIRGLTDYIQRMLSEYSTAQVRAVQNPIYAGAEGALQLAQEMPKKYWDKLSIN